MQGASADWTAAESPAPAEDDTVNTASGVFSDISVSTSKRRQGDATVTTHPGISRVSAFMGLQSEYRWRAVASLALYVDVLAGAI